MTVRSQDPAESFEWMEFPDLASDEIRLIPKSRDEADPGKGEAAKYGFTILHIEDDRDIGVVYFAVERSRKQFLTGHLSYGVDPAYKGHHYASKACLLVREVALAHGFDRLFIGSRYENIASRKTIQWLGARPITVDDVPDEGVLDELKNERIDMFVWEIGPAGGRVPGQLPSACPQKDTEEEGLRR